MKIKMAFYVRILINLIIIGYMAANIKVFNCKKKNKKSRIETINDKHVKKRLGINDDWKFKQDVKFYWKCATLKVQSHFFLRGILCCILKIYILKKLQRSYYNFLIFILVQKFLIYFKIYKIYIQ